MHGARSDASMKRVPLGTPVVNTANTPFSHIRVVPQPAWYESAQDEESAPVMFQKQSYSQETEQIMAAPTASELSTLTASLANHTSGTTFAAKARAAELNAIRSRKAAKEMEMEDEVPNAGPIALGSIKFTKSRIRGKSVKLLGLDELPEEPVQGDGTSSDSAPITVGSSSQHGTDGEARNNVGTRRQQCQREAAGEQAFYADGSTPAPSFAQLFDPAHTQIGEGTVGSVKNITTGGDKTVASNMMEVQSKETLIQSSTGQVTARRSSTSIGGHNVAGTVSTGVKLRAMSEILASEAFRSTQAKSVRSQSLTALEEAKLTHLGVLPRLTSGEMIYQKTHDDPFVEQPLTMLNASYRSSRRDQQTNLSDRGRVAVPSSAEPALENKGFRSQLLPQPVRGQPPVQSVTKADGYRDDFTDGMTHLSSYQRDPKPYTSFTANKRESLLQNLQDVVTSANLQGNLPTPMRTVLFDPEAQQTNQSTSDTPARSSYMAGPGEENPTHVALAGKESLKTSDPLPWTNRPVNIHESLSPLASSAYLALWSESSTVPMAPPGLSRRSVGIWNSAPQTTAYGRSFEEANAQYLQDLARQQGLQFGFDGASTEKVEHVENQGSTSENDDSVYSEEETSTGMGPSHMMAATEPISVLMRMAYYNLMKYTDKSNQDCFSRYARPPEWCIDNPHSGNQSFFGDWGAWGRPPPRVGRDPRYRSTLHEGRYTVFEEIGRRPGGGRDAIRRFYTQG